jgi:hypothetical protein
VVNGTTDISMCKNDNCEKASECLRFMALESPLQSYFEFKKICKQPDFTYFIPIGNDKVRETRKDDIVSK